MPDISNWTENEKARYFKIVEQLNQENATLSSDEVDVLSENVAYAVVQLYRSHIISMVADIAEERQRSTWQKINRWFKRWTQWVTI